MSKAEIEGMIKGLVMKDPTIMVPNAMLGFTPLQCFGVTKLLLPNLEPLQAESAIAVPLAMIGLTQIFLGALPTLFDNRAQYKKPIWILAFLCCLFYLVSILTILDVNRVYYIDWHQAFAVEFTPDNIIGWRAKTNSSPAAYTYAIFLSAGQICYEAVAAYRAGVFLGQRSKRMMALYALTGLAIVLHIVVPWTIVFYSYTKGQEEFQAKSEQFSKAGVADVTFGVFVESITNFFFIYHLAEKMGFDRFIFKKLATSAGVWRLFTNIALSIATLVELSRPDYNLKPLFGGTFAMWAGWQINTFVQFSFVETKEIVQDFSKRAQGSRSGAAQSATESKPASASHRASVRGGSIISASATSPTSPTSGLLKKDEHAV
ncbi:hypothetical protein DFJ77DRAFT_39478 [Powellomyces hirtus]|nr:hypothetical protein DFJ77DRAFT_39478 [Powellomyces hirtus]